MENYNKGAITPEKFSLCVCEKRLAGESAEEFTLPDYRPEIRKLLCIVPTFAPPSVYSAGGRLELGGNVCYRVTYCGEDGGLYSVDLVTSYNFDTELTQDCCVDTSEGVTVLAEVEADSVTGRVIAPRKINVRTKMSCTTRAYASAQLDVCITGLEDESTLRQLMGRADCARMVRCDKQGIVMTDQVIPQQREGELRFIGGDGRVFVNEATAANGCIMCRGELILKLMLCREPDGEPECIVRKLPFSQEIGAVGVAPGCECRAWGDCTEVKVSVEEGRLDCEALMTLEAEAMRRAEFNYVKDIYSTCASAEVAHSQKTLMQPLRTANGNFTQSGVFDAAEIGLPAGAHIIDVDGHASATSIAAEGGRCVVTGEARYNILYMDGNEYGCRELVSPLRYETDLGGDADGQLDGSARMTVCGCRARMDGERVSVDSEICVALRLCRSTGVKMLSEARFSGVELRRSGDVVVCYPDPSDTLWSVARRYCADAQRICANNAVKVAAPDDSASLSGVDFLII